MAQRTPKPTDQYHEILAYIINRTRAILRPRQTNMPPSYPFPAAIEDNFNLIAFFQEEVMPMMDIEWPETYDNEMLKRRLSRDLILWYKRERPDVLYSMANDICF